MLCRADIAALFRFTEGQAGRAVLVCKHSYPPDPRRKFLNRVQTIYPRKNWSSVMLLNGEPLQGAYAGIRNAENCHWLVAEYPYRADAKIVHFTRGGPYFKEFRDCDYAEEWFAEFRMLGKPMDS